MTGSHCRRHFPGVSNIAIIIAVFSAFPRDSVSEDGIVDRFKFGEGLWETTVNVTDRAAMSRDIRDMRNAENNLDEVMNIYENGVNSIRHNTEKTIRTFKFFSKYRLLEGEFTYTVVRHHTKDPNFIAARISDIQEDSQLQGFQAGLITEMVLVSSMWMHVAHLLYDSIGICAIEAVDPNSEEASEDGGAHVLDEVAAYYIGLDQEVGSADSGYSLYNLAEKGREIFDTSKDGMARVNREIITLLKTAQDAVSFSNGCHEEDAPVTLRYKADQILSQMKVPLIQMLIHNMYKYSTHGQQDIDAHMTSVYAKVLVPHIAACSPDVASALKNSLYDSTQNDNFMSLGFNKLLAKLQSTYECLNISCEDVGTYKGGVLAQCTDPTTEGPDFDMIAGYQPTSYVRTHLLIDVDILQMGILMDEGAYEEAKHIYFNGRNSHVPNSKTVYVRTLQDLALSSDLEKAPFFSIYVDYYEGTKNYADIEIRKALDGGFSSMTDEQRTVVAVNSSVYMVLFMYIQRHMWLAEEECNEAVEKDGDMSNKDRDKILHNWDQAVAYFVGSLEGSNVGGSPQYDTGILQFNLNRQMCKRFSDCAQETDHHSLINDRVIEAFTLGKNQILEGPYCKNLKNTIISKIEPLLLTGLFQGLLSTSFDLTNDKDEITFQRNLVENYIYALSVIPIVNDFDPPDTKILDDQSINISNEMPPEDAADAYERIFDLVANTYAKTKTHVVALNCEDVGYFDDAKRGICLGAESVQDSSAKNSNLESSGSSAACTSSVVILLVLLTPLLL